MICKGVYNLAPTNLQQKHYSNPMAKKEQAGTSQNEAALLHQKNN
jgi:hypothetical protein